MTSAGGGPSPGCSLRLRRTADDLPAIAGQTIIVGQDSFALAFPYPPHRQGAWPREIIDGMGTSPCQRDDVVPLEVVGTACAVRAASQHAFASPQSVPRGDAGGPDERAHAATT